MNTLQPNFTSDMISSIKKQQEERVTPDEKVEVSKEVWSFLSTKKAYKLDKSENAGFFLKTGRKWNHERHGERYKPITISSYTQQLKDSVKTSAPRKMDIEKGPSLFEK